MATRVLIVDDHATFRAAARALLEGDGFDVVGEAATDSRRSASARACHPTWCCSTCSSPSWTASAVARELARRAVPPRVVLVSSRSRSAYRRRLAEASVCGFLNKAELSARSLGPLLA